MKKKEWLNPNKMKIETGHKTFDRQTRLIVDGNNIGDTEYGAFVRPWDETECNGFQFPPGELFREDLKTFGAYGNPVPLGIVNEVMRAAARLAAAGLGSPVLYKFRHMEGSERRGTQREVVHGYVLTSGYLDGYRLLQKFYTGPSFKSYGVIDECALYVSNTGEEADRVGAEWRARYERKAA